MADRDQDLAVARRLSQLLVLAAEHARADFVRTVGGFDLPVHLGRALLALDNPASMGDIADQLACDRSYVTALADGLEERGLVHRVPGRDRRVKILELTDQGRSLRAQIADAVAGRSPILALTDRDRADLERVLRRVLDTSRDSNVGGAPG